jgi:DNA-binding NtrC family response regulator
MRREDREGCVGIRPLLPESLGLFGRDPLFLECVRTVQRAAQRGLWILLEGETGTGKDMLARLAHSCGPCRGGPFVAVNCGCLSMELARSELFGHEKGAFTGAVESRAGAFELSRGGTLLLNELGELPIGVQVELLHVLDDKRWSRLGGAPRSPGRRGWSARPTRTWMASSRGAPSAATSSTGSRASASAFLPFANAGET